MKRSLCSLFLFLFFFDFVNQPLPESGEGEGLGDIDGGMEDLSVESAPNTCLRGFFETLRVNTNAVSSSMPSRNIASGLSNINLSWLVRSLRLPLSKDSHTDMPGFFTRHWILTERLNFYFAGLEIDG